MRDELLKHACLQTGERLPNASAACKADSRRLPKQTKKTTSNGGFFVSGAPLRP
jgi:hypothetical protein